MPNGELHAWEGDFATNTLLGAFDAGYHTDPSQLHNALPPEPIDPSLIATLGVVDDVLTITHVPGFAGSFQVMVTVSDGTASDSKTFVVTVVA